MPSVEANKKLTINSFLASFPRQDFFPDRCENAGGHFEVFQTSGQRMSRAACECAWQRSSRMKRKQKTSAHNKRERDDDVHAKQLNLRQRDDQRKLGHVH